MSIKCNKHQFIIVLLKYNLKIIYQRFQYIIYKENDIMIKPRTLFWSSINRSRNVIKLSSCKLLCYTDDMKLFMTLRMTAKLQSYLNRFTTWLQALIIIWNLDKLHIMTYSRSHKPILNVYHSGSFNISHISCVIDL